MTKYRYRPERSNDERLTWQMIDCIQEHAQLQYEADLRDFSLAPPFPRMTAGMVRIVIEAAMIEYPEL
jgi:hypothetical protein